MMKRPKAIRGTVSVQRGVQMYTYLKGGEASSLLSSPPSLLSCRSYRYPVPPSSFAHPSPPLTSTSHVRGPKVHRLSSSRRKGEAFREPHPLLSSQR